MRKRRQLKPEEKIQIYKEATVARVQGNGSVAEVLRRWGIHSIILNWDEDLRTLAVGRKIKRGERSITLSLFKQFYEDRASLNSWLSYGLNGSLYNSWWWKTILTHKFNSNWSAKASMSIFGGKSDQFFGQYDKMDNFELNLNYSF